MTGRHPWGGGRDRPGVRRGGRGRGGLRPQTPDVPLEGTEFVSVDLRDPAAVHAFFAALPRLDVLVNNAGGAPYRPLTEADAGRHARVIELNLVAPLTASLAAYEHLRRGPGIDRDDRQRERGAAVARVGGLRGGQGGLENLDSMAVESSSTSGSTPSSSAWSAPNSPICTTAARTASRPSSEPSRWAASPTRPTSAGPPCSSPRTRRGTSAGPRCSSTAAGGPPSWTRRPPTDPARPDRPQEDSIVDRCCARGGS